MTSETFHLQDAMECLNVSVLVGCLVRDSFVLNVVLFAELLELQAHKLRPIVCTNDQLLVRLYMHFTFQQRLLERLQDILSGARFPAMMRNNLAVTYIEHVGHEEMLALAGHITVLDVYLMLD